MTNNVTETLAPVRNFDKKKIAKWSAISITAVGVLLVVSDRLKKAGVQAPEPTKKA